MWKAAAQKTWVSVYIYLLESQFTINGGQELTLKPPTKT